METIKIKATIQGERIDKFLTNYLQADFDFSRSLVQKYILDGHVKANGEVVTNNYNVLLDDEIEIMIPEPENLDVKGEDIPFEILFEDDDLIVLNKPNNLVVHPLLPLLMLNLTLKLGEPIKSVSTWVPSVTRF
jgi:23S rRNA pseudouridine1911/1915/1917 synthase